MATEYVVVTETPGFRAPELPAPDPGINWCRIGAGTVYWHPGRPGGQSSSALARLGAEPKTATGSLYLLAQEGDAFVREHPEVRIVLDHGRYLVVDLTDDEAPELAEHHGAWFGFSSLPVNTVVLATPPLGTRRVDPEIAALVAAVSPANLSATIAQLAAQRTRHSATPGYTAAARWVCDQLGDLGFAVTAASITVGSGPSRNVIADRQGTGTSRRMVIVSAHLDSVNAAGGMAASAPGADDNASGVAGVLEIARVLSTRSADHDLRLILFGGEEQGLHGSQQYVAGLSATERTRLDAVINMDMIGKRNTAVPGVLLEGAAVSQQLMDELAGAARDYTALTVQTSLNPFASDHVPFINAGLPALLTIEASDTANRDVHTANDTPAMIDADLAAEIVRMNLAVAATRLHCHAAGVPRPRAT